MTSTWAWCDDQRLDEREPIPAPARQPALRVGAANDPAERDADRVADDVVRRIALGGEHETRIRRSTMPASAPQPIDPDLTPRIGALRRHGASMPANMRRQMEEGFGADFTHVRIHTGTEVDTLNDRLSARAFTVGSDVFFRGGRPDATTADGRRLVAHELAHALQAPGGGETTVRRVQTPDAPEFNWTWSEAEKTTTYRNYLLTLKWQLMTNNLKDSVQVTKVDQLLAQQKITQKEVQDLIAEVRTLAPGKPKPAEKREPLTDDELKAFRPKMARARALVDGILRSPTAISDGFGAAADTDGTARKNLALIKAHLDVWETEQKTRVTINRSPNAGYVAFNTGRDDTSKLTVADDFFSGDPDETAQTLIHEASHGKCGTTDLAYMSSPYFMKLRDELALTNADNYKYAAKLGAGMAPLQAVNAVVRATTTQLFEQALSVCFYKCSKVWLLLNWLRAKYEGTDIALLWDTRVEHEEMMELGADTALSPMEGTELKRIAAQRTIMLTEIVDFWKGYSTTPKTFALAGTVMTVTPINNTWPTIDFDITGATTAEGIARCIFIQTLQDAGFTDVQSTQLFNWCDALFNNMRKDDKHKAFYMSATDLQLYEILKG